MVEAWREVMDRIVALVRRAPLERYDTHGWMECVWCHGSVLSPRLDWEPPEALEHAADCAGAALKLALAAYDAATTERNVADGHP